MFDLMDLWKKTNNATHVQMTPRTYPDTTKQAAINFDRVRHNPVLSLDAHLTSSTRLPGASLYLPVVLSLCYQLNPNACVPLPRRIPNSTSVAWPMSLFSVKPGRPFPKAAVAQIEVIEEEKAFLR